MDVPFHGGIMNPSIGSTNVYAATVWYVSDGYTVPWYRHDIDSAPLNEVMDSIHQWGTMFLLTKVEIALK